MNIGIIYDSKTGNTNLVVTRLKDALEKASRTVTLERLQVVGEIKQGQTDFEFEKLFDASRFDALVLGSHVEGFMLCPVMKSYLSKTGSLQGRKVAILMTQHFSYKWMGGNSALKQFEDILKGKGAQLCSRQIVNWSNKKREQMICDAVNELCRVL